MLVEGPPPVRCNLCTASPTDPSFSPATLFCHKLRSLKPDPAPRFRRLTSKQKRALATPNTLIQPHHHPHFKEQHVLPAAKPGLLRPAAAPGPVHAGPAATAAGKTSPFLTIQTNQERPCRGASQLIGFANCRCTTSKARRLPPRKRRRTEAAWRPVSRRCAAAGCAARRASAVWTVWTAASRREREL